MKNYLEEVLKLLREGIRELGLELKSECFTLHLSHLFKNNISWGTGWSDQAFRETLCCAGIISLIRLGKNSSSARQGFIYCKVISPTSTELSQYKHSRWDPRHWFAWIWSYWNCSPPISCSVLFLSQTDEKHNGVGSGCRVRRQQAGREQCVLSSPGMLSEPLRSGHWRLCGWLTWVLVKGGSKSGDGQSFFSSSFTTSAGAWTLGTVRTRGLQWGMSWSRMERL